MPHWIAFVQLTWASRHLDQDSYTAARKFFPGQALPEGEYIDGQTGAYCVVCESGQTVPESTVYITTDSLRDLGEMA